MTDERNILDLLVDTALYQTTRDEVVKAQAANLHMLREAVQMAIDFHSLDTEHFVAKYGPGMTTKALCDRLREVLK